MTLRQLLATWVVHDLDHVMQVTRVMARQYAAAVGPLRRALAAYARDSEEFQTWWVSVVRARNLAVGHDRAKAEKALRDATLRAGMTPDELTALVRVLRKRRLAYQRVRRAIMR